jgi:mono/diheme cytochrome c family protein
LAFSLLASASVLGCGEDDTSSQNTDDTNTTSGTSEDSNSTSTADALPDTDDTIPSNAPTYYKDIKAIIDRECASCHQEGGAAPFALNTYVQAKVMGPPSAAAVTTKRMPPWMPDPTCRPLHNERLLTEDEITLFADWVAGGMLEGNPADAPDIAPPVIEPFAATHTATMAEGYTPNAAVPDDYRCFILDLDTSVTRYLTGSQVKPGAGPLVHHVLVYAVPSAQVPTVEALDAEDAIPGYTCFGGPFSTSDSSAGGEGGLPTQIGAWVPGSLPNIAPDGMATRITAGSKIVMQVHYNTLGGALVPDQTQVEMILTEDEPDFLITTRPLPIRDLDIKAGDAASVFTHTFFNFRKSPLRIISTTAHMHLLGKRLEAHHINAADERSCMLRVPQWDFQWQQGYRPVETIEVLPGESIELTCEYDNSAANQPIVNGVQTEPRDVTWGEGTTDEMCLLYLQMIDPFTPAVDTQAVCQPAVSTCAQTCDTSSLDCTLGCDAMDGTCFLCSIDALVECTRSTCGLQLLNMRNCLTECGTSEVVIDGDITSCFEATCPAEYAALQTCADPILDAGTCDTLLAPCGLTRPAP